MVTLFVVSHPLSNHPATIESKSDRLRRLMLQRLRNPNLLVFIQRTDIAGLDLTFGISLLVALLKDSCIESSSNFLIFPPPRCFLFREFTLFVTRLF